MDSLCSTWSEWPSKTFFYADFVDLHSEICPAKQHIMENSLNPKKIMIK